jgi:hypothetical protein
MTPIRICLNLNPAFLPHSSKAGITQRSGVMRNTIAAIAITMIVAGQTRTRKMISSA